MAGWPLSNHNQIFRIIIHFGRLWHKALEHGTNVFDGRHRGNNSYAACIFQVERKEREVDAKGHKVNPPSTVNRQPLYPMLAGIVVTTHMQHGFFRLNAKTAK
jgi:hypothetical protein